MQWKHASQLAVEDRVQSKWTEKDLTERAGALRSAHGSAATVKTAASCRRNRRKAMMTKWWKGGDQKVKVACGGLGKSRGTGMEKA